MNELLDLTVAEGIGLRWFLVAVGILLWHSAVSGVARRRATPGTAGFYAMLLAVADLAVVVVTLAGMAFVLLAITTWPGPGDS